MLMAIKKYKTESKYYLHEKNIAYLLDRANLQKKSLLAEKDNLNMQNNNIVLHFNKKC